MTALAEQLAADGYFPSTAVADSAITAGQVYKDGNNQVRVLGAGCAVVARSYDAESQVASLTQRNSSQPGQRGVSPYLY